MRIICRCTKVVFLITSILKNSIESKTFKYFSTTECDISDWVSEAAKAMTVELTYDRQGRPSGTISYRYVDYQYLKREKGLLLL